VRMQFVNDGVWATAPKMPHDRPPTRAEVWAYVHHCYEAVKTHDEMVAHAKCLFVGNYVYAVNLRGWDKPPDWTEGDPAPPKRCPTAPIPGDEAAATVYRLLEEA